jgi:hypothetical protein
MKEPWCLAVGDGSWTIAPSAGRSRRIFATRRSTPRHGHERALHRRSAAARPAVSAERIRAIVLLTLLGKAGESLGLDRHLKVNTSKHRTHSLFRQGCLLYDLIPNMPEAAQGKHERGTREGPARSLAQKVAWRHTISDDRRPGGTREPRARNWRNWHNRPPFRGNRGRPSNRSEVTSLCAEA